MNLADFKIGQWYAANNRDQPNFHFKAIEIDSKRNSVKAIKVGRWKGMPPEISSVSNPDYWKNATPVNYSDIEHLIPEEFKEKQESGEALLFN